MLTELLRHGGARSALPARSLEDCLRELAHPFVEDTDMVITAVLEREAVKTTALGSGVAVPHARLPLGKEQVVLNVGYSPEGIDMGAPDGKPVHLIFLLLSSPSAQSEHLSVLARIAKLLKLTDFLPRVYENSSEIYKILAEEEEKLP